MKWVLFLLITAISARIQQVYDDFVETDLFHIYRMNIVPPLPLIIMDSGCNAYYTRSFVNETGIGSHGQAIQALYRSFGVDEIICYKILHNDGKGKLSTLKKALKVVYEEYPYGAIVSLSISISGTFPRFDKWLRNKLKKYPKIHHVFASGNYPANSPLGKDACLYSPCNITEYPTTLITVGALGFDGKPARYSRNGPCVRKWAPGWFEAFPNKEGSSFSVVQYVVYELFPYL
jgi:hypothetical protein